MGNAIYLFYVAACVGVIALGFSSQNSLNHCQEAMIEASRGYGVGGESQAVLKARQKKACEAARGQTEALNQLTN